MHLSNQLDALLLVFVIVIAATEGRRPPLHRRESYTQSYRNSSAHSTVASTSSSLPISSLDITIISTSLTSSTTDPLPSALHLNESVSDTTSVTRAFIRSTLSTRSFTSRPFSSTIASSIVSNPASSRSSGLPSSPSGVVSATSIPFNDTSIKLSDSFSSQLGLTTATLLSSYSTSFTNSRQSGGLISSVNLTVLTSHALASTLNESSTVTDDIPTLATSISLNSTTERTKISSSSFGTAAHHTKGKNHTRSWVTGTGSAQFTRQNCTRYTPTTITRTSYIATVVTTITSFGNVSVPYTSILNSTLPLPNTTATLSGNDREGRQSLPACPLPSDMGGVFFEENRVDTTTIQATSKQTVLNVVPETSLPSFGSQPVTSNPPCRVGLGHFMHRRGCLGAVEEFPAGALATPQPPMLSRPVNQETPQGPQPADAPPQNPGQSGINPESISSNAQQGDSWIGNPGPGAVVASGSAAQESAPIGPGSGPSPVNAQAQSIGPSPPSNEQLSNLGAVIASAISAASSVRPSRGQEGNDSKGNPDDGSSAGSPASGAAPAPNPNPANPGSAGLPLSSGNSPAQIEGSTSASDEQFRGLGSIIASVIDGAVPAPRSSNPGKINSQGSPDQDGSKDGLPAPGAVPVSNPPQPTRSVEGAGSSSSFESGSGSGSGSAGSGSGSGSGSSSGSPPISGGKAPDDISGVGQGEKPVVGAQVMNAVPAPTIEINGQNFQVNPSQLVAPGTTIAISAGGSGGGSPPPVVINGQNFQLNPSQLISSETTITLPNLDSGNHLPLMQQQGAGAGPMPLVVAGQTASVNAAGAVAIGGQTVAPGASAITVGGTPVFLGPSGLVVGSSTIPPTKMPEASAVATIAGQVITPIPIGAGYIVAGSTVAQGAPAITISGTPVSLEPSGLVVGGSTVELPTQSVFNVAGQPITANSNGFILAAGSEVSSSGSLVPVTAGGISFSIGSSIAVIDGISFNLATPTTKVFNGQTVSIGVGGIGLASTTIPIPGPETLRPVTAGGVSFSIGSSVAVIDGISFNLATPTTKVLNGQTVSIGPNGIGFPSTTVPIQNSPITPTPVTAGGITFGLSPSIAVIDGTTFTLNPNSLATIVTLANGQTVSIGPAAIGFATTTVPVPKPLITPTPVTAGGITLSLSPSLAVIDGTTFTVNPHSPATTKTLPDGQVVSIGPNGIGFATTTISILNPSTSITGILSSTTINGITLALGSSIAVIDGTTFRIGPGSSPTTDILNGQTISIGSNGIGFASTTIPIPKHSASITGILSSTTINGIPLALGSSIAVIDGTTFEIGPGSSPTTDIVNGQTISIGPNGIGFASTTIRVPTATSPPSLKSTTINGIPLALGSSIAVINGTTFKIGAGATPTTDVVNGQTLSLGPGGVGFPSTTVGAPLVTATGAGGGKKSEATARMSGVKGKGWLVMASGLGLAISVLI